MQIFQLGQRWRRVVDERLKEFGLTEATWRPLLHLGRIGDGPRQHQLAESMRIQGPSLVRLLDNLERDGLIRRADDPGDRRARLIYLTDAGRSLSERVVQVTAAIAAEILAGSDGSELAAVEQFVARLDRALSQAESSRDA